MGTGAGVETLGQTQYGNGDGSGDGNESSSEDGNGGEDGYGDGNEDGIGEGGGDTKKRKKPHKNCRRDQALLFRMHRHLCRQGVAIAGTRQLRLQGLVSLDAHRTEGVTGSEGREGANGVGDGVGVGGGNGDRNDVGGGKGGGNGVETGTGLRANEGAQDGNEDGSGDGAGMGTRTGGWRPLDEHRMGTEKGVGMKRRAVAEMGTRTRITGTRIGSGRAEKRRRSARNHTRVVDAMWETGETWVERGKIVGKKGLVQ